MQGRSRYCAATRELGLYTVLQGVGRCRDPPVLRRTRLSGATQMARAFLLFKGASRSVVRDLGCSAECDRWEQRGIGRARALRCTVEEIDMHQ